MGLGLITWDYRFAMGRKTSDWNLKKPLMDIYGFIDRVAELKLDGFQCETKWLKDDDDAMLKKVRAKAESLGLYIELGAFTVQPDIMRKYLEMAKKLNASVIRTAFRGSDRFLMTKSIIQKELNAYKSNLRKSVKLAEKYQIKIAVENHQDFTATELLSVIKTINSDYVGICLDNGNSVPIMQDPYEEVKKLAPYAFAVHFKDYAIYDTDKTLYGAKIVGVPYGQGVFDLPRIWKIIKTKAPSPNITIECTLEPKSTVIATLKYEDESIKECVRYAREILKI